MNSASSKSKNIVNSVGILSDTPTMNNSLVNNNGMNSVSYE